MRTLALIRAVKVKDPQGKFEPQAFLCTDLTVDPTQILHWFRQRWQVEVTFLGSADASGGGNATAVVRLGAPQNHSGFAGAVLTGNADGAFPTTRFSIAADSLVRQTVANVCRCTGIGALPSLEVPTFSDIHCCDGDGESTTGVTGVLD